MSKRHHDQAPAEHPWDQQPGETAAAHRAFSAFRDLGPTRTLTAAQAVLAARGILAEARTCSGRVNAWSTKWKWVERARAWDNHLQAQRDRVAAEYAARWERRRFEALETNWEVAQKLRDKAGQMMLVPIVERTSADGRTVIKPGKWTFSTATDMLRLASDLESSVLGAATRPAGECTDSELEAIEAAAHAAKATLPADGD